MAQVTRKNSDIIKGSSLMVFLNGEAIAFATNHSFNKTLNLNETACKDAGDYTNYIPGNISWEATTENLYSVNGWQTVNDAFTGRKPVQIAFGTASNYSTSTTATQKGIIGVENADNWTPGNPTGATGCVEYGKAYISSLQVTAQAGENATFTATFTGSGDLSTTAPTAAQVPE